MIRGVHHIEIVCRDVNEMADFFKTMGFEEIRRTDHHGGAVEVKLPGEGQVIFEFHQMDGQENPGINHIALLIDDSEKTVAELKAKGLKVDKGPFMFAQTGRLLTNCRDPQGFRLQFTE